MANSVKKKFKISKANVVLAYTAGLIDGEAYIGIDHQNAAKFSGKRRSDFYRMNVSVNVTDKSMTDFLMRHFGGYYRTRKRLTVNGRLVHSWYIDGDRAIAFLKAILPYMVAKKDQARLGIKFRKSFGPMYCKTGVPSAVIKLRHSCYEKFKEIHGRHSAKALPPKPLRLPER